MNLFKPVLGIASVLTFFTSTIILAEPTFLSEEDVSLFHKQGYLLKENCLSPQEVEFMTNEVSNSITLAMKCIELEENLSAGQHVTYLNGSRIVYQLQDNGQVAIARINGICGINPVLQKIICSKRMIQTFSLLLGTSDLEHIIAQVHPKLPGDGISFPAHRDIQFRKTFDPDWEDILGNGSYAICILAIDPMSQENGGLWIDKKSYSESSEEDLFWVRANPGDLLFLHPHILHGSGPNLSATSRRTLLTGFCAFGANHKAYPGALVNTHFHLMDDGSIQAEPSPWSQVSFIETEIGH